MGGNVCLCQGEPNVCDMSLISFAPCVFLFVYSKYLPLHRTNYEQLKMILEKWKWRRPKTSLTSHQNSQTHENEVKRSLISVDIFDILFLSIFMYVCFPRHFCLAVRLSPFALHSLTHSLWFILSFAHSFFRLVCFGCFFSFVLIFSELVSFGLSVIR